MKKDYFPYIIPFAAFLILTYAGAWVPGGIYAVYPLKTLIVGGILLYYRKAYTELSFHVSRLAIPVGALVFLLWILPEHWVPHLGWSQFNPYPASFTLTKQTFETLHRHGLPETLSEALHPLADQEYSTESDFLNALKQTLKKDDFKKYRESILQYAVSRQRPQWQIYFLIAFRLIGAVIVVPIFEELFWRSFVLRWLINEDFRSVPIGTFSWFSATAVILAFAFEHHRWFAGIFAGLLYHALLYYKKDISACVIAHATTNLLLAVYVLLTQQWSYW
ncbi:CAAX prenyl protease-related protein [candidate division KSB3 bacterium]|uniref:CAAX prenyl protease-related protein n=1 Tax=candidate division KSB3 bacterium TaxID=2044937 RepID=A0A2G6E598_9BACT|nr:MAG: CAAX prenyl protease-related protein [candidate division KSB3 bacterium]PIE29651.1 MAG: CAAX prenyl protease-related protein [candidate division KSB3 bacterium]